VVSPALEHHRGALGNVCHDPAVERAMPVSIAMDERPELALAGGSTVPVTEIEDFLRWIDHSEHRHHDLGCLWPRYPDRLCPHRR
jgi:hypothetical protein